MENIVFDRVKRKKYLVGELLLVLALKNQIRHSTLVQDLKP